MPNIPITFKLQRIRELPEATIGIMEIPTLGSIYTMELPWRHNKKGQSCIPHGEYELREKTDGHYFARYKALYGHEYSVEVAAVKHRTAILIHKGNWPKDTRGCILLGMKWERGMAFIGQSEKAYLQFYKVLHELTSNGLNPKLEIRSAPKKPKAKKI